MPYIIKTPEHHATERARQGLENRRRLDYDVEDVGLSSWASSSMMAFHDLALDALALGEAHGFDGPAMEQTVLVDAAGEVVSDTIDTAHFGGVGKRQWRLSRDQRAALGRYAIPTGETSRIQRALGMRETTRVVPASRYVEAGCAGVGCPVFFTLLPAR